MLSFGYDVLFCTGGSFARSSPEAAAAGPLVLSDSTTCSTLKSQTGHSIPTLHTFTGTCMQHNRHEKMSLTCT